MFSTRLRALKYPHADRFDAANPAHAATLYAWLEDHYIRQLPLDQREPLRSHNPAAIRAFVQECQAPAAILAHLDAGRHEQVCSWLLGLALAYEYSDKYEDYELAYKAAVSSRVETPSMLPPEHPELKLLAATVKVELESDAALTLNSIVRAARKLPRRKLATDTPLSTSNKHSPPLPTLPNLSTSSTPSNGRVETEQRTATLEPLSESTFPLGFSLGDESVDDVARVLRMLHVQRLRELQDGVNAVIECMQEFTANPKTDTRLGKVGKG